MEMIINVEELNKVCALPDRKFSTQTHYKLTNRELVHEVFGYQKFQDDFDINIRYTNDGKNFIGTFRPSYTEYIKSIIKTLNLKLPKGIRDDDNLTNLLLDKVEILRTVQNSADLHNEFPLLYRIFQDGKKFMKEIESEKGNPIYKEKNKEDNKYYYSCGLRSHGSRGGFDDFVPIQVEVYKRFVERRKDYKKLVDAYSYDDFIKENYDISKLAMYIAHKYLEICERSADNRNLLSKYAKLLDKYINENSYDKTTSITIDHKIIDYDNILSRVNLLNTRINKMDGEVPWVLIPEGKRTKYIRRGLDPQSIIMTEEALNALREAGEEKEAFYKKNEPLLKAYGTLKYKGYIAYIYPNGEVLLDTLYDANRPSTAKDNAIYYIPARYFDMVSGLDKQVLMRHPAVKRIYHAGNWQERAQKIIDAPGKQEEQEQAKQLVKRIIRDNEKDS